ncbi:MAG: recombinase family protein [Hyphomonas sp.]|jgi:DNA invertase Pin-like site-specific DNA recombinase|nr:recombinase family protein [Hyphomonas sp.]
MKRKDKYPRTAIGYIRVSTELQAEDPKDLETQAGKLREFCERERITLLGICEDVASGADPLGDIRRPGLLDSVRLARARDAVLIVPEPTRLFRDTTVARRFLVTHDVRVFSVDHGRILSRRILLQAIEAGAPLVQNVRRGTSEAMARQKATGVTYSTDAIRRKAGQASAKARAERALDRAHRVADILSSGPAMREMTHQELADLLNRKGILSGLNRPLTARSARTVRKQAEALIRERAEVDSWPDDPPVRLGQETLPASSPAPAPVRATGSDQDDLEELKRNPMFGMF